MLLGNPLGNGVQTLAVLLAYPLQKIIVPSVGSQMPGWDKHGIGALDDLASLKTVRRHAFLVQCILVSMVVINEVDEIVCCSWTSGADLLGPNFEFVFGVGAAHVPRHLMVERGSSSLAMLLAILDDVLETVAVVRSECFEELVNTFFSVAEHD